jgi:hypothetical protein
LHTVVSCQRTTKPQDKVYASLLDDGLLPHSGSLSLAAVSRYMNRIRITVTVSFPYITQNKIKAKKSNKTAGERELTDPLRDNNEVDPEEDENMIIGFNHLLPFDVDARREHRGTFTKEPVVYYPCVFPIEVYETATA